MGASRKIVGTRPENKPRRLTFKTLRNVWKIVLLVVLSNSILGVNIDWEGYLVFTRVIGSMMVEQIDRAQNPAPKEYKDLWLMFLHVLKVHRYLRLSICLILQKNMEKIIVETHAKHHTNQTRGLYIKKQIRERQGHPKIPVYPALCKSIAPRFATAFVEYISNSRFSPEWLCETILAAWS